MELIVYYELIFVSINTGFQNDDVVIKICNFISQKV